MKLQDSIPVESVNNLSCYIKVGYKDQFGKEKILTTFCLYFFDEGRQLFAYILRFVSRPCYDSYI